MSTERPEPARFEQFTSIDGANTTLIEGLPGHGLVAAIAVDQIQRQLDLDHHGSIVSEEFPQVATFQDGLVRDLVRVYAGSDPAVMTLQSDLALPPWSFRSLTKCVINDLADQFEQAIFLAGAPAESEGKIGTVTAAATTPEMKAKLEAANVPIAENIGLVGDVTGALANECYHADVPAAILIVRSHPWLPDPGAAQSVIETALEPLVDFDVDTTELRDQADEIQDRMEQMAQQYRQMTEEVQPERSSGPSMYQ